MAAYRIRRGTLTIGSQVTSVTDIEFDDEMSFDRSKGDDELAGDAIKTRHGGRGRFKLLGGSIINSGYLTQATLVVARKEVEVSSVGVETVTTVSHTFYHVTLNVGGGVPAEGVGALNVEFEYAYRDSQE